MGAGPRRREMSAAKITAATKTSAADRAWFATHPWRSYRVRRAILAELPSVIAAATRFLDRWAVAVACGWPDLDVSGCKPDRLMRGSIDELTDAPGAAPFKARHFPRAVVLSPPGTKGPRPALVLADDPMDWLTSHRR